MGNFEFGGITFSKSLQVVVIETVNCASGNGTGKLVNLFSDCLAALIDKSSRRSGDEKTVNVVKSRILSRIDVNKDTIFLAKNYDELLSLLIIITFS